MTLCLKLLLFSRQSKYAKNIQYLNLSVMNMHCCVNRSNSVITRNFLSFYPFRFTHMLSRFILLLEIISNIKVGITQGAHKEPLNHHRKITDGGQ
jgi:hypothetical protein